MKGIGIAYTLGGFVIFWCGLRNQTPQYVIKNLLQARVDTSSSPQRNTLFAGATPKTPPSIGVNSSSSGSGNPVPGAVNPNVSSGSAQNNANSIYGYLRQNGYSEFGAAGVVTCIFGESGFNPEAVGSGGAGLIGWTPPSKMEAEGGTCHAAGIGNNSTSKDLENQMAAIIAYNDKNGPVNMLNAATSIQSAADIYSQYFERPAVLNSDVHPQGISMAQTAINAYNTPTG